MKMDFAVLHKNNFTYQIIEFAQKMTQRGCNFGFAQDDRNAK